MADEGKSLRDQINDLSDNSTEELGRWVRMHVLRVGASVPEFIAKRRRRHVAPRSIEITKEDAQLLVEILQHGLDADLPGTIGFTLYGREEL